MPVGFEYFGTHQMPFDGVVEVNVASTVHIGAVLPQWDGITPMPRTLADSEVPVSRGPGRAISPKQAPPGRTSQGAEHQAHHGVVHGREARIAEHDDVFRLIV